MTTVGYGNIAPITPLGQLAASCLMILGYAIIAVPTGIVSVEIAQKMQDRTVSTQACLQCGSEGHTTDAQHCKDCGANLGTGDVRSLTPRSRSLCRVRGCRRRGDGSQSVASVDQMLATLAALLPT